MPGIQQWQRCKEEGEVLTRQATGGGHSVSARSVGPPEIHYLLRKSYQCLQFSEEQQSSRNGCRCQSWLQE